ncbi:MAG: ATP-binding protein [Bacteroidota bacterium]
MVQDPESADRSVFNRLRRAYLLALSLIALALIAEQILVNGFLESQENDANIVNVAGRQRMLSQLIAKRSVFRFFEQRNSVEIATETEEWLTRHEWLKRQLFDHPVFPKLNELDPTMQRMLALIDGVKTTSLDSIRARPQDAVLLDRSKAEQRVEEIDSLSEVFLERMDAIVAEVSVTASGKVGKLQQTKWWLVLISLGILLLEALFIFRPINRFVRRQFSRLAAEKDAQVTARAEAERASKERERSLAELQSLNQAIDEAALFATLRQDGAIIYLSRKFRAVLGLRDNPKERLLSELLHPDEGEQTYFANLFNTARAASWRGEWLIIDAAGAEHWLEVALIPARQRGSTTELFLLASEVTERKRARQALDLLNQERLLEEVERGKQRSRQITEAQEKERLRIARDLHDGIGQQLTSLKFSLESLRPDTPERNAEKIRQLRELSKEIIRSVRMATFNLAPPELTDYGLVAALEKMASELSRLTGERIVFQNKGFVGRLEPTAEINLYRIIQEAVNNAIKYAGANYILISLSSGESLLSITIDDDGEGFDPEEVAEEASGGGHGLANMEDRIHDINGRIFLRSDPESGTRITINVPI